MVNEILNFLGELQLNNSNTSIKISKENFYEYQTFVPESAVYAIDGGNGVIIDGGNWLVSKIKIGLLCYNKKECVKREVYQHYLGVAVCGKKLNLRLDPKNEQIEQKNIPSKKIEEVSNICMKLLEWQKVDQLAKDLQNQLILTDGLPPKKHKNTNVTTISICKSSRLGTNNGRSLIGYVGELSLKLMPDKKWFYYPVFDDEENTTVIAKFHEKSNFCYRVQISGKPNFSQIKKLIGTVAYFSSDPELLGYPYPLLKADKIARLRDDEKDSENYKLRLLAEQKGIKFIQFDQLSTIMHSLLDERAYR